MLPGSFSTPWALTEVLLKGAPQQDLNLWPMKCEAAPPPNLLEKLLSWWVESNWPELSSGQDPREKSYFSFEVGGFAGSECPSGSNDCLCKKGPW